MFLILYLVEQVQMKSATTWDKMNQVVMKIYDWIKPILLTMKIRKI